jgi:transcriptional regulator with XRE-family HTH domain
MDAPDDSRSPGTVSLVGAMGATAERRRTELGLTLREVAHHAGLSLPYIANLEKGRGNPTIETIVRMAVALDLSVTDLVGTSSGDARHRSSAR